MFNGIENRIVRALDARKTVRLSKRDYVYTIIDTRFYRLWNSTIAEINDITITVNNHGWFTNTTRSRLSTMLMHYANIGIVQKKGAWYFYNTVTREVYPYHNGATFSVKDL